MSYRTLLLALTLLSSVFLTACGGGGGGSTGSGASPVADDSGDESGQLELLVTDAEEDFITYQVSINGIELERRDGSTVEVIARPAEVDFVQYQELSELFAVSSIPSGVYEKVIMTLDYTDAEIVVQNEQGQPLEAQVVDPNGNAVTELDVEVTLGGTEQVVITPTRLARLTLDLDLGASNSIVSFEPPVVEVEPFVLARAFVDEDRELRVRGLLADVDEPEEAITLSVRPMRLRQGDFGRFTFKVDEQTLYEVDGLELTGAEGLSAMADLASETPVVAFGSHSDIDDTQVADRVLAGSSVAWAGQDLLRGIVRAREGNRLTIAGAVVEPEDRAAAFLGEIALTLDETTRVTGYRPGEATIEQLSVGTSILALGQFEQDSFSAEGGIVRMRLSRLTGQVNRPEPLTMDLLAINRLGAGRFDFSGTGMSEMEDADPENYEIDTANLDASRLAAQEWIQVRGFPTAFGSAPLDFRAFSIINPSLDSALARYIAHWGAEDGGVRVDGLNLIPDTSRARESLRLRGLPASVTSQFEVAVVTAEAEGRFALLVRGEGIRLFRNYVDFVAALGVNLDQGKSVSHLAATGSYNDTTQTLTAQSIQIRM